MQPTNRSSRYRKIMLIGIAVLSILFAGVLFAINTYLEPILRSRLNTLIIAGSDSLYTYHLGTLETDIFGGNVEVGDLQLNVDSSKYKYLESRGDLPSLTMQVNMDHGHIRGIGLISLLLGKQINIEEILSKDATINLSRHPHKSDTVVHERLPVWKAIQPKIKSISIRKIKLDGIRLFYKEASVEDAVQVAFDRCDALMEGIKVDSLAAADTSRIGFMERITFNFNGLNFLTRDSVYKMRAGNIHYSSAQKRLEVDSFHLQPTLNVEAYTARDSLQKTLYNVLFDKVKIENIRIDKFIRNDVIEADSIIFYKPTVGIFLDKTLPPSYASKIGKYPHEHLQRARSLIRIKNLSTYGLNLDYVQKEEGVNAMGKFSVNNVNVSINNITNDRQLMLSNPYCTATATGNILGNSPITASFKFYLDSANGRFDASGNIKNVTAAQVNPISFPLANIEVKSLNVQDLSFDVKGSDYTARSIVKFRYSNASFIFHKTDEETGEVSKRNFLTKLIHRITYPSNPGPDGVFRVPPETEVSRLTTESFFGIIWKAISAGMQNAVMKSD